MNPPLTPREEKLLACIERLLETISCFPYELEEGTTAIFTVMEATELVKEAKRAKQ